MLDVDFVRRQFPALDTPWALFDNAGGSVVARPVIERVGAYMSRFGVQLGASYALSVEASETVAAGKAAAARLIGGTPQEVAVGPSSTALVQLLAAALRPAWREGDEVVITNADHEANVTPWRELQKTGIVVREWRIRPETAELHAQDLDAVLSERTRLVAFAHVSNIVGSIHDVPAMTARIRAAGALSCVDGVAFAPHRRVDAPALGADFYFFSFYKTFGPHQAALFGRREQLERLHSRNHSFLDPTNLPYKLEPGHLNHELVASLVGITDYLDAVATHHGGDDPFELFAEHEAQLAAPLLAFLDEHPRTRVVGRTDASPEHRVPTISFVVEGAKSSEIPPQLDAREVAVRWGHFYGYGPVRDLGLLERDGVVRVSMLHYNTPGEVERLIGALGQLL